MSNLTPRQYGLEVRSGFKEYAYGFAGESNGVRAVIPYEGSVEAGTEDRLFVATREGIYNVSSSTTTPGSPVYTWTTKTGDAGYCSYTSITLLGGKWLLICDAVNGYVAYEEDTHTWSVPAVTNVSAGNLRFVTVWKNRVWFVEKDSGTAWYLGVGSVAGAATSVDFGNRFIAGGFLNSLWSFTRDAGQGIDDFLIVLSSAGDCLVYSGTDPDTDLNLVGNWVLGKLPKGRRVAASVGGDLYVISSYGIISIAQVLNGVDLGDKPSYITGKITPMVSSDFAVYGDTRGWDLVNYTSAGLLVLVVPIASLTDTPYRQYVMNTDTRAWTRWDTIPMDSVGVWKGEFYFGSTTTHGTSGGGVHKLSGNSDHQDITVGDTGIPINSFLLTSYGSPGNKGNFLQVPTVRPFLAAIATPTYDVSAAYDFDLNDQLPSLPPTYDPVTTGSVWDSTEYFWDTAVWTENYSLPVGEVKGTYGIGRFVALKLRMSSSSQTTFLGFAISLLPGGPL
jgi:hypothetical protein